MSANAKVAKGPRRLMSQMSFNEPPGFYMRGTHCSELRGVG